MVGTHRRSKKIFYRMYTLCHRKNISCDEVKVKIIPVTENILHLTHTVLLVIGGTFPVTWWNIPMSQENFCDIIQYLRWQKEYNIWHIRKFISGDRNKKEHQVLQYIFPVNVRIFLDSVFLTSLVICYNSILIIVWMMVRFPPVLLGEIIYWKKGPHEIS